MDYGAGSGVLALTALRLGAAAATGTDVDACAVTVCRRNAELNNVGRRLLALPCERDLQVGCSSDCLPILSRGTFSGAASQMPCESAVRGTCPCFKGIIWH